MPERWKPEVYTKEDLEEMRAAAAARLLAEDPLDAFDIAIMDRAIRERTRQLTEEGWSRDHDDEHVSGQMAQAASCYAEPPWSREGYDVGPTGLEGTPSRWPWNPFWWKPSDDRLREIEKAIALLFAEGARIMREQARGA